MIAEDRAPRYRRLRATGAMLAWHPCEICGDVNAPWGYGVTGKGIDGSRWRCSAHRLATNAWGRPIEETAPTETAGGAEGLHGEGLHPSASFQGAVQQPCATAAPSRDA